MFSDTETAVTASQSVPTAMLNVVSGRITTRFEERTAKYLVVQNCHPEKVTNKATLNNTFL